MESLFVLCAADGFFSAALVMVMLREHRIYLNFSSSVSIATHECPNARISFGTGAAYLKMHYRFCVCVLGLKKKKKKSMQV